MNRLPTGWPFTVAGLTIQASSCLTSIFCSRGVSCSLGRMSVIFPWASTCTTTGMTWGLNSTSDPDDASAVPANAARAQPVSWNHLTPTARAMPKGSNVERWAEASFGSLRGDPLVLLSPLLREQTSAVRERLELQRIAGRVEQEHRGLFAGLAPEAHVRFDHETGAGFAQPFGERVPRVHVEHHAEVAHRHVVAVDVVRRRCAQFFRRDMRDDLVAIEVEIHPGVAGASFRATEQAA